MALDIMGDGETTEVQGIVGWSENASGERRAVRWYMDGGWQVEGLGQLAGFSQSVARGGAVCPAGDFEALAAGGSYGPGAARATIWGISTGPSSEFTRDLNDLVIGDNPPALRVATGVETDANCRLLIPANGVTGQPGGYGMSQSGTAHAYLLVETELVPISRWGLVVLTVFLICVGGFVILRRGLARS
jgi:hypothetical protein